MIEVFVTGDQYDKDTSYRKLDRIILRREGHCWSTKEGYRCVLKQYIRYLCENNILLATSNDIYDYIDDYII